ncbi:MAG: hypothetical protein Q7R83_03600, partial [bacterium]|nr:hypothetical protein [bacterium]
MKKLLLLLVAAVAFSGLPFATQAAFLSPGDLIKGKASTVYYYGSDGHRYVFPNEKTYFTWYSDWSGVTIIDDAELAVIPLGPNITYRPGSRMVKIESDNRAYVVDRGGILRYVPSEEMAQSLYGINWRRLIEDIPVTFFQNYRVGAPLQTAYDFRPADTMALTNSIATDKFLPDQVVTIGIDTTTIGFVPSSFTVKPGTTIVWRTNDNKMHTVVGDGWTSTPITTDAPFSKTLTQIGS